MLEKLLEALRKNNGQIDKDTDSAMRKMQKQKRLSSKEFLKVHDAVWQEGPKTKFQTPDEWLRHLQPQE
jgi:hypothetical protein